MSQFQKAVSRRYAIPLPVWDTTIAAALFVGGLAAYAYTLAPTVLNGDAALFQYIPSVLGITYPTGYPTYILLGWLWSKVALVGSVAYRMNLLSAVCGALALAFAYQAACRLLADRWAALVAVLVFATLPTYWRWATEARIYTLHILFLSAILCLIVDGGQETKEGEGQKGSQDDVGYSFSHGVLPFILLGLSLGNHNTTLLLIPGLVLLFWLERRPRLSHIIPYLLPVVVLPLLLYSYIPLRAEWLLAREGNLPGLSVPVAVARGLVADFYHSGFRGLVRYFTAADFTGGVVTNWRQVPGQLITVYWPLVRDDFTWWGALWGVVGAIYFALWRPRRFWPLFLIYVILIPFVLAYGQGEQSAFLLPSSLMLSIFIGAAVAGGFRLVSNIRSSVWRSLSAATLILAIVWLPIFHAQRNIDWLTHKWDDSNREYWTDVLAHPLESGAAMLAPWGDLTTLWYVQHIDGVRPDLYGLYPPQEEVAAEWLAAERDLYVAGPLQDWVPAAQEGYQVLPWGRLVRLIPPDEDPLTLLPDGLSDVPEEAVFDARIQLLKVGYQTQTVSAGILPVTLVWRPLGDLPDDLHVSLRLVAEDGVRSAQTDDALLSAWLPPDVLYQSQVMLSYHPFKLPAGTLPGDYHLYLALEDWVLPDGRLTLDLGQVRVSPAPPSQPLDPWGEYKPLKGVSFGNQIRLVGYDHSVTRAGQGKGFSTRFLWQAIQSPVEDYTLLVELVDSRGEVWRDWRHLPADGRAQTSGWSAGQTVRDQIDLVLPANAPPGDNTLRIRLSWLRPDGTQLSARRWILPASESVTLPGVRVVEKEGRIFDPPPMSHSAQANFDDKIQLIGYNLSTADLAPGDRLPLTLVWRSRTSDMRQSYAVFVHLVGSDGTIYGQWDKVPGERGKQPTTGWVQDEVIVDPISVPLSADAPPGTYRVMVGLYLPPDGPRLPLLDESGVVIGDALELTSIQVESE